MLRLLKRTKGITLNKTAKSIISLYLKKKNIGELKDFSIDMATKKLSVSFVPKYFNDILDIEAVGYNIIKDAKKEKSYLTFDSIKTSNNWDNSNFNKLIKDKKIEIPEKYSKLVDLVA
jgi:hypothetical protein